MLDFLKRGYNNVREVIAERDKLLDIQSTVKLAADDGVVTFDEIRENLRKYVLFLQKSESHSFSPTGETFFSHVSTA